MIIITGLGNPGDRFERTRHNAGFIFMDELYNYFLKGNYRVGKWELSDKFQGWVAEVNVDGDKIILLKPSTFMNESGVALSKVKNWYKDSPKKQIIVVYDDLDLELGEFKFQDSKLPKSHNGVLSIVQNVGSDFTSMRIGVDSREGSREIPGRDYVLLPMTEDELVLLRRSVDSAIITLMNNLSMYLAS